MAYADLRGRTPSCNVEGCGNPARSSKTLVCEKHYYRQRRTGTTDLMPREMPRTRDHTGGYKLLYSPRHPISTKGQQARVYEHRAVYYKHHGEGPFSCVHCGAEVTWQTMHVDHLDDDPANNEIDNLGASCPTCNQKRGQWKAKRTARLTRSTSITWKGVTKPVGDWADELGIAPSNLKRRLRLWPLERAMTEPRGRFGPKRAA